MLLKALDLLRELGYGIIKFIYNLIDGLYTIINEINALDIIGALSDNTVFTNFYTAIITIAITVFALTVAYRFSMKVLEPSEGPSISQIIEETVKCGLLLVLSTFIFIQVSDLSIKLSGYVSSAITSTTNNTIGSAMLINYIDYSDSYKASDDFKEIDYEKNVNDGSFSSSQMYNDKFIVKERFIRSDERDYIYSINWIMAILVGGFFLYAMVFSAIMLGRRQIEFLFLFIISPIVFATSVCSKQRRSALIEQLVSLLLQGAVVVLIINIAIMVMTQIEASTFFTNSFQNIAIKSMLYLGCATFLMTGSQVINRFIGANVSANSGREHLMSLMGFGKYAGGAARGVAGIGLGAAAVGGGTAMKAGSYALSHSGIAQNMGRMSNNVLTKAGNNISAFGMSLKNGHTDLTNDLGLLSPKSRIKNGIGSVISNFGANVASSASTRNESGSGLGVSNYLKNKGSNAIKTGANIATPNPVRKFNYYNSNINRGG